MTKKFLLLICLIGIYLRLSASTDIECDFKTDNWNIVKNSYYCSVKNDPKITAREFATVSAVSGDHNIGMSNSDVDGFAVNGKTCYYFPRGFDKFFENIKFIQMYDSALQEVHQDDLKPFSKLVELQLYFNLLEILEDGLFDFNLELEFIYFYSNNLVHIESSAFDNLSKLSFLILSSNTCIDKSAYGSISDVKTLVEAAKSECVDSDFSLLKAQFENLQKTSKALKFKDFKAKFDEFEKTLDSSKYSNFFQNKLQALKAIKFDTCSVLELKVDSIATSFKDLITQTSNEPCSISKEEFSNQTLAIDLKLDVLDESVVNSRTLSLKEIQDFRNEAKNNFVGVLNAVKLRTDNIERKIEEQNSKFEAFEEKLAKIMKALNIAD